MIERLPVLEPRTDRSERTRLRCQKKFARHFKTPAAKRVTIERALCAGFGAIYLSSLAFAREFVIGWRHTR